MVLTLSRQFVTLTGTGKAVRVFFSLFPPVHFVLHLFFCRVCCSCSTDIRVTCTAPHTYTLTHHYTLQAFWIQIVIPQPKQTIRTHLPLVHYRHVRVHTRQVMGQVICWCWWGKATCLKNRTAFYSLALPGSLSGKLPCLKISESLWPNVACNLQQVTCSLALPLYWPRVNRPVE